MVHSRRLTVVTALNERIEQLTGEVHRLEYEMDLSSRLNEGVDGMHISTKVDEDVEARAIKAENVSIRTLLRRCAPPPLLEVNHSCVASRPGSS